MSFINAIENFINNLGFDTMLYICASVVFCVYLADILMSIFIIGYNIRKRLWCIIPFVFVMLFFTGCTLCVAKTVKEYSAILFLMGEGIILFLPLLFIPDKKNKEKEKQLQLARFIDNNFRQKIVEKIPYKENNEPRNFSSEINFTHVKNVIEKVQDYQLNVNEKHILSDLKSAVWEAEKGNNNFELKSKINDGLGALLKIMAKYCG